MLLVQLKLLLYNSFRLLHIRSFGGKRPPNSEKYNSICFLYAICGAQRTPMRFRADAMRNITDAPKLCFNQLFRFYYYSIVLRGPLQYCVG